MKESDYTMNNKKENKIKDKICGKLPVELFMIY
jgi:hypothetical protein